MHTVHCTLLNINNNNIFLNITHKYHTLNVLRKEIGIKSFHEHKLCVEVTRTFSSIITRTAY